MNVTWRVIEVQPINQLGVTSLNNPQSWKIAYSQQFSAGRGLTKQPNIRP